MVFGQRSQLWWDLPLVDSFDLLHHLYRTEPARHRTNLDAFVERLDLGTFLDDTGPSALARPAHAG